MPDTDIFDDNEDKNKDIIDPDKGNDDPPGEPDPTDQLLKGIVNENGEPKYKTVEDAIKASAHAQTHIQKLESELAELKEKGNASDKLDELLRAVKDNKGGGEGDDSPTMKPEEVLGIVKDYLSDTKAAETRKGNIDSVANTFKDRYGKDASKELYGKAADLGFSKAEINSMIANNPNAALKVLGVEPTKREQDVVTYNGGVDTSNFRDKPANQPKSIMGISSSKELVDEWSASKQRTLDRLGITIDNK